MSSSSTNVPPRPLLSHRDCKEYGYQAGFTQQQKGVYEMLNEHLTEKYDTMVRHGINCADADHQRSLSEKRALQAIERTDGIPSGQYI